MILHTQNMLEKTLTFVVSGFIILYFIFQSFSAQGTDIAFEYAEIDRVQENVELSGYIIRTEKLLTSNYDNGILYYSVSEGEKVAKNTIVANIYSDMSGISIQEKIAQIDRQISILKSSAIDSSFITSDISKIDNDIYNNIINFKTAIFDNKMFEVVQNKNSFLTNLNKRYLLVNSKNNFNDLINSLTNEKIALANSLKGFLGVITSTDSGYFSAHIDGYETVFTPEFLKEMTVDSFFDALTKKNEYENNVIGKLVTEFEWKTVCPISKKEALTFDVGKTYHLEFPYTSNKSIDAVLINKIAQTDRDEVLLVFEATDFPENFNFTRKQTIKVIKNEYSGLKVPKNALRVIDGTCGVYVLRGNKVVFKEVDILFEGASHYFTRVLSTTDSNYQYFLSLNDAIITQGKELYNGKIIE